MAYTAFDRLVAWLRFRAALPHIRPHARVCDIGCGHGARFLRNLGSRINFGVGVDYQDLEPDSASALVRCDITRGIPLRSEQFDHVVMLAVFEHLAEPQPILQEIFRILVPAGSLIMTWPEAVVDPLLEILHAIGFVSQEMESGKHQARSPLPKVISMLEDVGFTNAQHRKFEFGLNNLVVCYKRP